ncbi:hypothetical protein ABFX02_08G152100 [Erythranthe guttata]
MGLIKCKLFLLITAAVLLLVPYLSDSFEVTAAAAPDKKGDEALIQGWANFAVEEFNRQRHRNLKLVRIEKAEKSNSRSALRIFFTLIARDADHNNNVQEYKAMVRKAFYLNNLQLMYFKLAKLR